MDGDALRLGR